MALLRHVEGRIFNAQNDMYFLPADDTEYARLEKGYLLQLVDLGHLYIEHENVQRILAPEPGKTKRILDMGSGSGNWVVGMGTEFPHAEVIGIDLAPSGSWGEPPPNCRFEYDDLNLGLAHFYNSCDIVNTHSTSGGIKDYGWYINEAAKCLTPGGMLLLAEGHTELLNSKKELQEMAFGEGNPGESWLARTLFEFYNATKRRGSSADARTKLYELAKRCPLLSNVGGRIDYYPVGPWERGRTSEETRRKEIVGILLRQSFTELLQSIKPIFFSQGYDASLVQQFVDGSEREMNELKLHMYARCYRAWGTRNSIPLESEAERRPESARDRGEELDDRHMVE